MLLYEFLEVLIVRKPYYSGVQQRGLGGVTSSLSPHGHGFYGIIELRAAIAAHAIASSADREHTAEVPVVAAKNKVQQPCDLHTLLLLTGAASSSLLHNAGQMPKSIVPKYLFLNGTGNSEYAVAARMRSWSAHSLGGLRHSNPAAIISAAVATAWLFRTSGPTAERISQDTGRVFYFREGRFQFSCSDGSMVSRWFLM